VALEKVFTFLNDQPYRLILFGGKREIRVDEPSGYDNSGKWTDFYFAFDKVREIVQTYPEGTDFKMILITDGIVDPVSSDWVDQNIPKGADLKQVSAQRAVELLEEMDIPLYVMLVGDLVGSVFAREMVQAANGAFLSNRYAQGVSEFFEDDGLILRRFIYHVEPAKGLAQIEPIVQRITNPAAAYRVELSVVSCIVLFVTMLVGVSIRSFPGAGDREIVELRLGQPLNVAVDRLRRMTSDVPSWSWRGLSVVEATNQAAATFTLKIGSQDLPPDGFDLSHLEGVPRGLIDLSLTELRPRLEELMKSGDKVEMIEALNLDYVAPDLDPTSAEKILNSTSAERRKMDVMEFLRAKIHLLHNDALREKITGPRVSCMTYGTGAEKRELRIGDTIDLGRYSFRVSALTQGGRKDYRMTLSYEQVPSALWLKRIVPASIQRLLRFRRTHQRIVS
jgi:hypothetical protein